MNAQVVERTQVLIDVPSFTGSLTQLLRRVGKLCDEDEGVMFAVKKIGLSGFYRPAKVAVATPKDRGFDSPLITSWDFVRSYGLSYCEPSVPVRIALGFEEIRESIAEAYLGQTWQTITTLVDSSGPFIGGFGKPKCFLNVWPMEKGVMLRKEDVYAVGSRSSIDIHEPMLFAHNH